MCEVNYSITKKKSENSKYTYKNNEQGSQIFIFELVLTNDKNETSTIRRIKKGNQGNLISSDDSIKYNKIDKIKISVLDSNNLNNQIQAKIVLDRTTTYTTYITNEIYIEFNKNNSGFLECNYNIPQN